MMVEILKISREVADAIEKLSDLDASQILMAHAIGGEWPQKTNALNELSMEQLATALIVGYEVEMTPHEVIKADYENALKHRNTTHNDYKERFFDGYLEGVENTLAALNIKIKGVNDI